MAWDDDSVPTWIIVLPFICLAALIFSLMIFAIIQEEKTDYEMPNGVICKDILISKAAIRFADCDDGEKYINPEHYYEIRDNDKFAKRSKDE